jgi:hypothetical protein
MHPWEHVSEIQPFEDTAQKNSQANWSSLPILLLAMEMMFGERILP